MRASLNKIKDPKLIVLALTLLTGFVDGVAHQLTAPLEIFSSSDLVFTVIATLLIFIWYRLDSDERAYRRTPFLSVAMVALSILALPYYFYRSRGFRRGSIAVVLFVILIAAYRVLQCAGTYAAYYAFQN